jgi:hypothetical protein
MLDHVDSREELRKWLEEEEAEAVESLVWVKTERDISVMQGRIFALRSVIAEHCKPPSRPLGVKDE